jgi:regulator of sigma E protease
MLIVLGILLLLSLVVLHEFGHFWAARRADIDVEEFGVGFPPRAKVVKKHKGTEYTLNWLPLGGFVKLKGEHDADTGKGTYGAAPLKSKVLVMVAGVVMNLLAAIVLLTVIAFVGLPKVLPNQFSVASDTTITRHDVVAASLSENSPAAAAGLQNGDTLLSATKINCADGETCVFRIEKSEDLRKITESLAGEKVSVAFIKNNETTETSGETTLLTREEVEASRQTDEPKGYLGVVPSDYIVQRSTWSAPIVATVVSGQIVVESLRQFGAIIGDLFQGDTSTAKQNVTGVVGIGYLLGRLAEEGFMSVLLLTALISLSLAIMNILPIPALDGGRLFVTLLFRAIRKPLTQDIEEKIHGTGFALLMVLFLLITVLDVQRFIL